MEEEDTSMPRRSRRQSTTKRVESSESPAKSAKSSPSTARITGGKRKAKAPSTPSPRRSPRLKTDEGGNLIGKKSSESPAKSAKSSAASARITGRKRKAKAPSTSSPRRSPRLKTDEGGDLIGKDGRVYTKSHRANLSKAAKNRFKNDDNHPLKYLTRLTKVFLLALKPSVNYVNLKPPNVLEILNMNLVATQLKIKKKDEESTKDCIESILDVSIRRIIGVTEDPKNPPVTTHGRDGKFRYFCDAFKPDGLQEVKDLRLDMKRSIRRSPRRTKYLRRMKKEAIEKALESVSEDVAEPSIV